MEDVAGLLVSAALAALIARGALRAFADAGWTKENFRGVALPLPAGVVAVVAGVATLGVLAVADRMLDASTLGDVIVGAYFGPGMEAAGWTSYAPLPEIALGHGPLTFAPLVLGVAFLGLLDDLFDARPRGLRGHARAVLGGGFSTGAVKALGTAALAAAVLAPLSEGAGEWLLAALVITLATHLFNLLDLRPGRSWKVFVALGAGLLLAEWDTAALRAIGPFAGALIVLGLLDLRERCMLGDTGSNVLGALAGILLVVTLGTAGQAVAAAVLLALTAFGEFGSFTRTIDRVPPLRALDSLGRRSDG